MSFNIRQKRKQTTKAYRFSDKGKKLIRLTSTVNKSTASDITTPFEIRASSLPANSSPSDGWSTDDEADEVDDQPRRQTAAVKRAVRWSSLFPALLKAYREGYKQAPVAEALEPATHKMCGCAADKKAHKAVTCIFKCGIRQFDIEYCKSCPDYALPLVLMRSHMIPLTPKAPGHAVHIKLMQTIHNLHYICRVSVHNIAKWLQADFEQEVPASLKSRLNEVLPIFGRILLSLKKQLREEFGVENDVCPGCRYVEHEKTVALDGNFQLRRFRHVKDVQGINFKDEEEVNMLWVDDEKLIPYNESARDGCASFGALEKQGGSTKGLDQTGAFACTCGRHGFPLAIVDMRSKGERYTYVLSVLKKVTYNELYGNNIRIMYDVGCKLRTALKKTPELKDIEDVPIAVGIFHITGHNAACQIQFHPRLVKGFGMIDGEWLERMWSYLNGFVSITRTMSSLNRRLTLTIALDFFAKEKIDNIGITIQRKEQRAKQLLDDARKALQEAGYLDKLEILLAKWEEHIALATQEPTTETGRIKKKVDNAYEILRTAVSIYDIIDQAFKIQGNGHNRTQNLSDQKKSALAKVQKCLDAYNIVARNHSVIGLSPFDNSVSSLLAKNSKFRKHANLLSTMGDDLPYDALHGYLRAQEELKMLREEAMSVLKYGKELVHKLTEATKGPELFDNLSDEVLGMAVICKQKLVEAERWNVDQKRRLTRIAAGLHSVASSGNVRGEDGEEVEEEAEDEECADLAQFENWIESIN